MTRKFTWEVVTRREDRGPPEGDGWEPFSTFNAEDGSSYWHVYVSWRRKIPS